MTYLIERKCFVVSFLDINEEKGGRSTHRVR
jgi:hypothetical protein